MSLVERFILKRENLFSKDLSEVEHIDLPMVERADIEEMSDVHLSP